MFRSFFSKISQLLFDRNLDEDKEKLFEDLTDQINNITYQYLLLLGDISDKSSNDMEVYKRKFNEVRLELYQFLNVHKRIASLKSSKCLYENAFSLIFDFGCFESVETFLDYDKFVSYRKVVNEIREKHSSHECFLGWVYYKSEISEFLEHSINVPSDCSETFKNIQFLDAQKWKNTKCSYIELERKITRRRNDLINSVVSNEQVEELSFIFDNTYKYLVPNIDCSVCQENFEIDQELSRMPCGHLFHKGCIKQNFKTTEDCFEYDSNTDSESEPGSNTDPEEDSNAESEPGSNAESVSNLWLETDFYLISEYNLSSMPEVNLRYQLESGLNEFYQVNFNVEKKIQCPNCRHVCC